MILVTGGTGCVGSHVVRALVRRGDRVRVLCLPDEGAAALSHLSDVAGDVEVVRGDVRDEDAVRRAVDGCDAVFHLAAVAGLNSFLRRRMHEVNVVGTRHVAAAAARVGARLVHTSSASAVGLPPDGVPVDETFDFASTPVRHPYPLTKRIAERVVLDHVRAGADAVVLNPGAVLAPGGDWRNTWSGLVVLVARGRLPVAPPGGFAFVGREQVVAAHLAALDHGVAGERYLVVGRNTTYAELVRRVAAEVGARPPRGTAPAGLLRAIAAGGDLVGGLVRDPRRAPALSSRTLPFFVRELYYDGTKAERSLGVEARPLDATITELTAWCRSTGLV